MKNTRSKHALAALGMAAVCTFGVSSEEDVSPVWTADGDHIFFYSYRGDPAQLYRMSKNGDSQTRITNQQFNNWWMLTLPPHRGQHFIITSDQQGEKPFTVANLYIYDAVTENYSPLTTATAENNEWATGASASADGRYISYIFRRGGFRAPTSELRLIDRQANKDVRLQTNYNDISIAALSPDGDTIYFASRKNGTNSIYLSKRDGSDFQPVITMEENAASRFGSLNISADGKKIAFSYMSGDFKTSEIFTADADGKNIRRLTFNHERDGAPVWSPDGRYIAFESNRDGEQTEIYRMKSDGSEQINLTRTTK